MNFRKLRKSLLTLACCLYCLFMLYNNTFFILFPYISVPEVINYLRVVSCAKVSALPHIVQSDQLSEANTDWQDRGSLVVCLWWKCILLFHCNRWYYCRSRQSTLNTHKKTSWFITVKQLSKLKELTSKHLYKYVKGEYECERAIYLLLYLLVLRTL